MIFIAGQKSGMLQLEDLSKHQPHLTQRSHDTALTRKWRLINRPPLGKTQLIKWRPINRPPPKMMQLNKCHITYCRKLVVGFYTRARKKKLLPFHVKATVTTFLNQAQIIFYGQ